MVATILTVAGYRVGLRTSPYLQVATEKLQIGPSLIDASSFAEMTARVLGTAAHYFILESRGVSFSYAEAWSVLGYWWFAEREVTSPSWRWGRVDDLMPPMSSTPL